MFTEIVLTNDFFKSALEYKINVFVPKCKIRWSFQDYNFGFRLLYCLLGFFFSCIPNSQAETFLGGAQRAHLTQQFSTFLRPRPRHFKRFFFRVCICVTMYNYVYDTEILGNWPIHPTQYGFFHAFETS